MWLVTADLNVDGSYLYSAETSTRDFCCIHVFLDNFVYKSALRWKKKKSNNPTFKYFVQEVFLVFLFWFPFVVVGGGGVTPLSY